MKIMKAAAVGICLFAGPMADAQNSGQEEVVSCGIGWRGDESELSKQFKPLAMSVLAEKNIVSNGALLRKYIEEGNPQVVFRDFNNKAGVAKAIAFIISSANVEKQVFKNPIPPGENKLNVIYTLGIQTVVFNLDSMQVEAVYPWVFKYNDAAAKDPTEAEIAARFSDFFKEPPALAEGEEPDPRLFLNRWKESARNFQVRGNPITIAVAPVVFSPEAEQALAASIAKDPKSKANVAGFGEELSATLEAELSQGLGLPVIPGGGGGSVSKAGDAKSTFIARIPGCFDARQTASSFQLPVPAFRFHLAVDQVASHKLTRQENRERLLADGGVENISTNRTEVGYGARYLFNIVAPVEGDETEWGGVKLTSDQKFRLIGSKRYAGDRDLVEFEQYQKLSLGFASELSRALMTRDEKWIKNQLSSQMGKVKPSAIRKEWIDIFEKRMNLKRAKK
jgi:hypothetical protein